MIFACILSLLVVYITLILFLIHIISFILCIRKKYLNYEKSNERSSNKFEGERQQIGQLSKNHEVLS